MGIMLAITDLIGYYSQVRCLNEDRFGLLDGATTVTSDDVRGCDTPGSIATGTSAMDFGRRVGFSHGVSLIFQYGRRKESSWQIRRSVSA